MWHYGTMFKWMFLHVCCKNSVSAGCLGDTQCLEFKWPSDAKIYLHRENDASISPLGVSTASRRGQKERRVRKVGTVQVAGRKYLLVALSCNINPLKQIWKDKHTPQEAINTFLKLLTSLKWVSRSSWWREGRAIEGAQRSDRAGPFDWSDSRQSGSAMARHGLGLQPELPQYAQYNVLLCYGGCRSSSHLQPGPFLPGGPRSGQNTPQEITQNATEGHSQRGWNGTSVAHEMRIGKYGTGQGRKTVSRGHKCSFFTSSLFSAHSSGLFVHKRSQMPRFDVNEGQLHSCH